MEEAILALLREAPGNTLTLLYKQHKPSCVAFMRSIYHDDEQIDYIFTEALLVLNDKARQPGFRLTCPIQTFLKAVCRNQIRKRKYEAGKRHDHLGDGKDEFLENLQDYFDEEAEKITERDKLAEQVIKEMQANFPKCYEILKRLIYYGQSMEKIAKDLGYSNADSVKNQKYKCLKKFKEAFFKRSKGGQNKQK